MVILTYVSKNEWKVKAQEVYCYFYIIIARSVVFLALAEMCKATPVVLIPF